MEQVDTTPKCPIRTRAFSPPLGSAVDVFAEEISYLAWEMTGASPRAITSENGVRNAGGLFRSIVESTWAPGKVSISTELAAFTSDTPGGISCRLVVGVLGRASETADEVGAIRSVVQANLNRPGSPYSIAEIDPLRVLEVAPSEQLHSALIGQRQVTMDLGDESVDVLSRWHPVIDPWMGVARLAIENPEVQLRIRTTLLATRLGVDDHIELDRSLDQVHRLRQKGPLRPDHERQLERAAVTLADLKASFSSPLLAAELSVVSSAPLADTTLRAIASVFTSDIDVHRTGGSVVVAGQSLILGGHEIDRQPVGLEAALGLGLPLKGGLGPRDLRSVVSLTEAQIVGWPIPAGTPIPTVPTLTTRPRPIPGN